jgi:AcrR family transcriptional regulator
MELEDPGLGSVAPSSRLERRRERNREHLSRAGGIAFGKFGYTRTSVERIIVEADVTRATFYRYFSSKDEVFGGLIDALVDELIDCVHVASEERSIRTRLQRRTAAMLDVARRNRDFLCAVREAVHVSPDHAAHWGRLRAELEAEHGAALGWCARRGIIDADDVQVTSRLLSGMIESMLLDARHDTRDEPSSIERILTGIYWNSLFRPQSDDDLEISDDFLTPRQSAPHTPAR